DQQPVAHLPHLRWLVGGLGSRPGQRPGVAGDRIRPRRQRAHPGRLLRRRRGPAQSRSGGRWPLAPAVRDDVGGGADGTHDGRCGADAGRDGRPRPTRPAVAGGAGSSLHRRGSRADAAAAGRLQPRPGRDAGRGRSSRCLRTGGGATDGGGRRGGGGIARPDRRAGGVPGAAGYVAGMQPLYATDRDRLKPDIIWNIEFGLSLSVERVAHAEQARGALFQRMSEFMAGYDLLICPTACVAPFDVSTRWIREVSGVRFDNYVEWLRITSAITLTSCPVVALPCGLTEEGLPVGMQLVGRPRGEWQLLSAAAAVEQVFEMSGRVPMDPRGG